MQHSTSSFLTTMRAAAAAAALALCAITPALAHGHARTGAPTPRTAAAHAPRAYRTQRVAPRVYRAPRAYRAQRVAPRVYRAPRAYRTQRVAPRVYRAPRTYRTQRVTPRMYRAPRAYRTQRHARSAPFEQRVRTAPRRFRGNRAPFVQYVRAPQPRRRNVRTAVVRSPLMRAVYAGHRRRIAYHPAYLTGRIVEVRPRVVVLQPPTGRAIPVRCDCYRRYRAGSYAAVPAVYENGGYDAYAYSPQYYPQVAQWYSTYYGAPVNYSNGYYVPSYQNSYAQPYYTDHPYYANQPYYANPNYGSTPYDQCMWSDNDGDESQYCAAPQPASYGASPYDYAGYGNGYGSTYAPQQLQGLVVAKSGSILMVLGENGLKPVLVDASPALQNGYAMNGPVAVGQVIDAYGYYSGNSFTATALM